MTWQPEPEQPDVFDCPGCGNRLVWADAVILGCSGCDWEFFEADVDETTFETDGL